MSTKDEGVPIQLQGLFLSREEICARWKGNRWSSFLATNHDCITLNYVFDQYTRLSQWLPICLGKDSSDRDLLTLIPELKVYIRRLQSIADFLEANKLSIASDLLENNSEQADNYV